MNRPNIVALFRLLATRRRIEQIMWKQRAEAIREELRSLRMTW